MLSDLIGKMIAPILSGQLELTLAKVFKLTLGVGALRGPVVGFPFSGTVQIAHLALRQFKDTLKKAENATVGKIKSLNFNDLKAAARNFSVSP
jgi:hypothetical protein